LWHCASRTANQGLFTTFDEENTAFHDVVFGNFCSIDSLLAVELILKIYGGRAGGSERSAEKSALGHGIPFFRLEIIKLET
jgi:hypothetical protein